MVEDHGAPEGTLTCHTIPTGLLPATAPNERPTFEYIRIRSDDRIFGSVDRYSSIVGLS